MSAIARRKRSDAGTGIDVLFEEHAPMVLAICRYHLRDPQAAEDAAQEVFLSAHRSLLGGTRPREAAAWLATIARNQCRRALRAPHAVPLDEERTGTFADPAEIVAERADISDVTAAIAELPARQREALVMRELWGLSYEQVAAAMHLSASAVDSLLSRARRRLSEQFGDLPKAARGVLVVPDTLREQLSRFIPELDPAVATVASGAGATATLASLGSGPAVAKAVATGAAAVAIAVPVHVTMRADSAPRAADRAAVTRTIKPEGVQPRARPVVARPQATQVVVSVPRKATSSSKGAGSGSDSSSSGQGSSGSGSSGSDSGHSGSGSSGSSGSGSSGSGSGSSGSGSGSSGSGHSGSGSPGSGSGSSGSGSGHSGSGHSGSGSGSTGSVSGSSGSGSGSSGSGSGSSGSGSGSSGSSEPELDDSSGSGSGGSGSGSGHSGSG